MPFGLYLHFPFCRLRCSYCDSYKEDYTTDLERQFYKALTRETELAAAQYASYNTEISSIYVGGGTPSLTNLDLFSRWLQDLKRHFLVPDGIEFTIECHPESVTIEQLAALKELGVNRPVFGVQSFSRRLLKTLNCRQDPYYSQRAIYWASALGYTNFGADLIFGLPGQTSRMFTADIEQLLDLAPPHISFYQLRVKTGTELAANVAAGSLKMPGPELTMAMYRSGCGHLAEAGYERYEVSSFARPGCECRHNLEYWKGRDFLGLGPSAHSFMNGNRFVNVPNLLTYIERLRMRDLPHVVDDSGAEQHISEAITLGLRTSQGICRSLFSERFGVPVETRLNREQYRLLVKSGYLLPDQKSLKLSEEGISHADEITHLLIE